MARTWIITIIMTILICGSALCFYDFPKKVNVVRDAVIYTEDNLSTTMSTKIHVVGTLYKPLFRQNTFKGNIYIEADEFTKDKMLDIFILEKENGINMGGLMYQSITHSPISIKTHGTGTIWFDDNFQNINIWTTPTWGQSNNKKEASLFIVTGNNYEQALKTQQRMKEKFGKTFVPK